MPVSLPLKQASKNPTSLSSSLDRPIQNIRAKQITHVSVTAAATLVSFYFLSTPTAIVFTCVILSGSMYFWPTSKKVADVFKGPARTESKQEEGLTIFNNLSPVYTQNQEALRRKAVEVNSKVVEKFKSGFTDIVQDTIFNTLTPMDNVKFYLLLQAAHSYGVMNIVANLQLKGIFNDEGFVADENVHQRIASGNMDFLNQLKNFNPQLDDKPTAENLARMKHGLEEMRIEFQQTFGANLEEEFAIAYNLIDRNREWQDIEKAGDAGMWAHHFFTLGRNQKWNRSNVLFYFFDEKGNLSKESVNEGMVFLQKLEWINSRYATIVHGEGNFQTYMHPFPKNSLATTHAHAVKLLEGTAQPSHFVQMTKNVKVKDVLAVGQQLLENL